MIDRVGALAQYLIKDYQASHGEDKETMALSPNSTVQANEEWNRLLNSDIQGKQREFLKLGACLLRTIAFRSDIDAPLHDGFCVARR